MKAIGWEKQRLTGGQWRTEMRRTQSGNVYNNEWPSLDREMITVCTVAKNDVESACCHTERCTIPNHQITIPSGFFEVVKPQ